MIRITLSPFNHKGQKQIKIHFIYDLKVKEYVKQFPKVKWSQTHKAFYVPYSRSTVDELFKFLRTKDYFVDYSQLMEQRTKTKTYTDVVGRKSKYHRLQPKDRLKFDAYKSYLEGLRLSENTVNTYINFIADFLIYLEDRPLKTVGNETVKRFIEDIIKRKSYSISTHRQLVSAIKHFGDRFSETTIENLELKRPRKDKRLPAVLSQQEIIRLLRATANLKHRTTLALLYSAGMRISELIHLKLSDIDVDRRQIIIKNSKGRKDRYVVMAESFLPLFKNYVATYQPAYYFIEGAPSKLYSPSSIRAFLKRSCQQAGITKHITPHTLRHSYATHLIENGVGLRYVQELLGHSKPETTMIYTHVAKKDLLQIKSPLDRVVIELLERDKAYTKVSLSGKING